MRRAIVTFVLLFLVVFFAACSAGYSQKADDQRAQSIETRAEMFARATAKIPVPQTENFPMRAVLAEYTSRADLLNHPWYTYIYSQMGTITSYFVSTTVPVNSCAFLGSTEDVYNSDHGNLVLTAPSLDGVFYGGAGASSACNGWIFIDAATGAMGLIFGASIQTYDAPLILETEPLRIQPVVVSPRSSTK